MANVLSMTEGVQDHEGLGVLLGIRDPQTKFHKIRQLHKSIKQQKEAVLHLWYTTHPLASWSLLHQALNMIGDIKAAKTVQEKFLGGVLLTLGVHVQRGLQHLVCLSGCLLVFSAPVCNKQAKKRF